MMNSTLTELDPEALDDALDQMDTWLDFVDEHREDDPEALWSAWQCTWSGKPYPPGGNELPAALYDFWKWDREMGEYRDRSFYAHAVCDAWNAAETPGRLLDRADWVDLWSNASGPYVVNGLVAPRHRRRRPVAIYRVALPGELEDVLAGERDGLGLSWTTDLAFARSFQSVREGRQGLAHVILSATVAPNMLLGELTPSWEDGRGEPEILADVPASLAQVL